MDWHNRNLAYFTEDLKQMKCTRPPRPVKVVECYCYEGEANFDLQSNELEEKDLQTWLNKDIPEINSRKPIAGFKLILSPRKEDTNRVLHRLPFSLDVFKIIYEDFGLHPSFVRAIIRAKPTFCQTSFSHRKSQTTLTGYLLRSNEIGGEDVVLSTVLDHDTHVMGCILHGCTDHDIKFVTEWLHILKLDIFHPLLLPALTLDLIRTKHSRMIEEKAMLLVELAGTDDQYDTRKSPGAKPLAEIDNYNKTSQDLLQLHQDIGDHRIAVIQSRKHVQKLAEILKAQNPPCPGNQSSTYNNHLKERLDEIIDTYDDLEIVCCHITQDCNFVMGGIYNIIAQRQNQINVGIAAAAKRDSSAMKTIAIMTMLFLPGTFVAAFFAMPLFNWSGGLSDHDHDLVVNPRFRYYWIVTVPLTALVFMCWMICNRVFAVPNERDTKVKIA